MKYKVFQRVVKRKYREVEYKQNITTTDDLFELIKKNISEVQSVTVDSSGIDCSITILLEIKRGLRLRSYKPAFICHKILSDTIYSNKLAFLADIEVGTGLEIGEVIAIQNKEYEIATITEYPTVGELITVAEPFAVETIDSELLEEMINEADTIIAYMENLDEFIRVESSTDQVQYVKKGENS